METNTTKCCGTCLNRNPSSGYCLKKGYEVDEREGADCPMHSLPFKKRIDIHGEKQCSRCKKVKPLLEFEPSSISKDGRFHICNDCQRIIRLLNQKGRQA